MIPRMVRILTGHHTMYQVYIWNVSHGWWSHLDSCTLLWEYCVSNLSISDYEMTMKSDWLEHQIYVEPQQPLVTVMLTLFDVGENVAGSSRVNFHLCIFLYVLVWHSFKWTRFYMLQQNFVPYDSKKWYVTKKSIKVNVSNLLYCSIFHLLLDVFVLLIDNSTNVSLVVIEHKS
jgi:hypothetical protein